MPGRTGCPRCIGLGDDDRCAGAIGRARRDVALIEHPVLAALSRLSLHTPAQTRYREIRASRRADQLSTLEATMQAPALLESPPLDPAPLLDAFGYFVACVEARQRLRTAPGSPKRCTGSGHFLREVNEATIRVGAGLHPVLRPASSLARTQAIAMAMVGPVLFQSLALGRRPRRHALL